MSQIQLISMVCVTIGDTDTTKERMNHSLFDTRHVPYVPLKFPVTPGLLQNGVQSRNGSEHTIHQGENAISSRNNGGDDGDIVLEDLQDEDQVTDDIMESFTKLQTHHTIPNTNGSVASLKSELEVNDSKDESTKHPTIESVKSAPNHRTQLRQKSGIMRERPKTGVAARKVGFVTPKVESPKKDSRKTSVSQSSAGRQTNRPTAPTTIKQRQTFEYAQTRRKTMSALQTDHQAPRPASATRRHSTPARGPAGGQQRPASSPTDKSSMGMVVNEAMKMQLVNASIGQKPSRTSVATTKATPAKTTPTKMTAEKTTVTKPTAKSQYPAQQDGDPADSEAGETDESADPSAAGSGRRPSSKQQSRKQSNAVSLKAYAAEDSEAQKKQKAAMQHMARKDLMAKYTKKIKKKEEEALAEEPATDPEPEKVSPRMYDRDAFVKSLIQNVPSDSVGKINDTSTPMRQENMSLELAKTLRRLLFRSQTESFSCQWKEQALVFDKPDGYQLRFHRDGPLEVMVPLQAYVLKHLLFHQQTKFVVDLTVRLRPSPETQASALRESIADMIWKAGAGVAAVVCLPTRYSSAFPSGCDLRPDKVTEYMQLTKFRDRTELGEFVRNNMKLFQERNQYGCISLLYSVLLSRGIQKLSTDCFGMKVGLLENPDMNDKTYISQRLANLCTFGEAVERLFNGEEGVLDEDEYSYSCGQMYYETGVMKRSEIGFLHFKEYEDANKYRVGSRLKTPGLPIWVFNNNGRLATLFCLKRDLMNDWKLERRFDVYYYDGIPRHMASEITTNTILTIDTVIPYIRNELEEEDISTLEETLRTKWEGATITWTGSRRF